METRFVWANENVSKGLHTASVWRLHLLKRELAEKEWVRNVCCTQMATLKLSLISSDSHCWKSHSRSDVSLHCTLTCTHPYFHSVTQAPEFYIGGEDWQVHGYNFSVGRCQWFGCFADRTGSGREDTKDTMCSLKLKKQATVFVIWGTLWGLTSESVPLFILTRSMFILTSCHREQKKSSWMGHVWFSCPLESICFPGLTNAPGEIKVW